jgi:hypothetical protein
VSTSVRAVPRSGSSAKGRVASRRSLECEIASTVLEERMNVLSSPAIQTIHLASAGRAAVLAQHLAPDRQLAAAIGDWSDRLVTIAPLLDITLNTRDVRTLLPAPIEDLETVLAKSHPTELRGYGAMDSQTAQLLDQWCAACGPWVADLSAVLWCSRAARAAYPPSDQAFPAALPLTRYQRMALGAAMQVAADTMVTLASVVCLARDPYPALFTSSLSTADIARCDATCTVLASLLRWGQQWAAQPPTDRHQDMVREHLRAADIALTLLFEGTPDGSQRRLLAGILIGLSSLKRCV